MPLYSSELDLLKKELVELRQVNSFYGYEGEELNVTDYLDKTYLVPSYIKKHLEKFVHEQEKDILSFAKSSITEAKIHNFNNLLNQYSFFSNDDSEELKIDEVEDTKDNYFNAPDLELYFDRMNIDSYHMMVPSREVAAESNRVLSDLDKIFQFEIQRLKDSKSTLQYITLQQKVMKVYDKIKQGKVNEASVLISRFYNENKQDLTVAYLYSEVLFAKASLGNQKSLAKAREVANTVCFLTDKSDEELLSYYRYLYVCREYSYDPERAMQLLRDFVLIDPDKYSSKQIFAQRNGFYIKSLILFLRFSVNNWSMFEIEAMRTIAHKTIGGGVFYIAFMRKEVLNHLNSVRFEQFIQVEIDLHNIARSHAKLIAQIKSSYQTNGLPNHAVKGFHTVGQKYLHNFFRQSKLPELFEYLANTSVNGIQYLDNTENDRRLASFGINEHNLWRAWVSKITDEKSLQRSDIIPLEQVAKEAKLLAKYADIANKAFGYEKEIYSEEQYEEIRPVLPEITQKGILSVMLGENKYSVFDYGVSWTGIKEYYDNIKSLANPSSQFGSDLILKKAEKGLFWNLEEIQMMLESVNLIIDNKSVGLRARLDAILNSKNNEMNSQDQYMSLSEHLELYWWVYILLVSLLIVLFNIIL